MGDVWFEVTIDKSGEPAPQKLWLWPGVVIVLLQWMARFALPRVVPDAIVYAILSGFLGGLAVIVWWVFFSRAPRMERWSAIVVMLVALAATSRLIDKSIATGMMGMMFAVYSIPVLSLAFVAGVALIHIFGQRLSNGPRRASMLAAILIGCAVFTLLRANGITGEATTDFAWRWSKTREERLVAQGGTAPSTVAAALPVAAAPVKIAAPETKEPVAIPPRSDAKYTAAEWPGFRGPGRNSILSGSHIETDWSTSPPVELWRRPIGPGWSSFAVRGDLLYTQEQRGDDEMVTCYNATSGDPVWTHRDPARFWESNGGAGPRGTPTLYNGSVYTLGATGILNALDAGTGALLWSRNAASDTATKLPGWGFASSPLVVGDIVIVATGGKLAAYDTASGASRWVGPAEGAGYSSPHLVTIDGVEQIVLMSEHGATSVTPTDGSLLWKHSWPGNVRIVQPAVTADGDLLIEGGEGTGMRRIGITHGPGGWTTEEKWTSIGLKPYFNDFVIHDGHVFGFDNGILACLDVKDGKRTWKGGRYGSGQLILLRDQSLLLVLSEEGELALVRAAPDQFTEVARFHVMEGKTWNHPVLVGDRLLVRNGNEMVAFRLSLAHS